MSVAVLYEHRAAPKGLERKQVIDEVIKHVSRPPHTVKLKGASKTISVQVSCLPLVQQITELTVGSYNQNADIGLPSGLAIENTSGNFGCSLKYLGPITCPPCRNTLWIHMKV